jgi:hypothetical protein
MKIHIRKSWYAFICTVLLALISLCLGASWYLALWLQQIDALRPDNYMYLAAHAPVSTNLIVGLVTSATAMTLVVSVTEWRTRYWWVPVVLLLQLLATMAFAVYVMAPVETALRYGIREQGHLDQVLQRWRTLSWIRAGLWSVSWALLVYYLGARVHLWSARKRWQHFRAAPPASSREFKDSARASSERSA